MRCDAMLTNNDNWYVWHWWFRLCSITPPMWTKTYTCHTEWKLALSLSFSVAVSVYANVRDCCLVLPAVAAFENWIRTANAFAIITFLIKTQLVNASRCYRVGGLPQCCKQCCQHAQCKTQHCQVERETERERENCKVKCFCVFLEGKRKIWLGFCQRFYGLSLTLIIGSRGGEGRGDASPAACQQPRN